MITDRRWYLRKRFVLPTLLSLVAAVATLVLMTPAFVIQPPREPVTSAVIAQMIEHGGRRVIRCAALLAAPPAQVWGVVTGYERFGQVFPMLEEVRVQREADDTVAMSGIARTWIGRMPFATRVKHERSPAQRAFWDEPGGALTTNRGSWIVTPAGAGTKLEYLLDIAVAHVPDAIVRAAVLRAAPQVVERVVAEVAR